MAYPRPLGPNQSSSQSSGDLVVLGAAVVLIVVLVGLRPFGEAFVAAAANIMMVIAPAISGWWCLRSNRGAPWRLVGSGLWCWASGQAILTWYEQVAGRAAPFPSFADFGYLAALPVIVVGLVAMLHFPATRWGRTRVGIEAGLITGAMLLALWPLALGHVITDRSAGTVAWSVAAAYPVANAVFVAATLLLIVRSGNRGTSLRLLGVGLLAFAVSGVAFAQLTRTESSVSGGWSDAGWILGSLLMGVAARQDRQGASPPDGNEAGRFSVVVGVIPHACSVGATLVTLSSLAMGGNVIEVQLWLLGLLVVLMGVNQLPVLAEASAWTQLLEDRVLARTAELHATAETLKQQQTRLAHLAQHDALTGLPNRRALFDALAAPGAEGRIRWVVLIDLDNFKSVNDGAGHAIGDAVLQMATARLQRALPSGDMVARLGGDEFAVLCSRPAERGAPTEVVDQMLSTLREPYALEDSTFLLDGSAGIAKVVEGHSAETALRDADVAMYAAKSAGRGRWVVHTEQMAAISMKVRTLVTELYGAIERDEFVVYFQPIVRLDTYEVVGAEALVRWQHPQRGQLAPEHYIGIAESTGAILGLGALVLRKALATLHGWQQAGLVDPTRFFMNINLSTKQLEKPGFVEELALLLESYELDAASLVLEVTETSLLSSDEAVLSRLEGLREIGARLAVDDFGTGYAGFEYLTRGLFEVVKLDRLLVAAEAEQQNWPLARAVIGLGEAMGFEVVAEGVEHRHQADALQALGCLKAQGFLFSAAVPADAFPALMSKLEVSR